MSVDWFLTTQGRIARIVVGSLLIILGLGVIGGFLGVLLLIVGAVPIASAAYGTFLLGPVFGRDIRGRRPEEQPAEEEKKDDDEDGDGDDGEAREDESDAESGGERRGEEPAEEPQEQMEKDTSGAATATRDESSSAGRRESTGGEASGSGESGSSGGGESGSSSGGGSGGSATGAPPLARAERPPGQGPRTKDVSSERSGADDADGD